MKAKAKSTAKALSNFAICAQKECGPFEAEREFDRSARVFATFGGTRRYELLFIGSRSGSTLGETFDALAVAQEIARLLNQRDGR